MTKGEHPRLSREVVGEEDSVAAITEGGSGEVDDIRVNKLEFSRSAFGGWREGESRGLANLAQIALARGTTV